MKDTARAISLSIALIFFACVEIKDTSFSNSHFNLENQEGRQKKSSDGALANLGINPIPAPKFPDFCFDLEIEPAKFMNQDFRIFRQMPNHIPNATPAVLRKDNLRSDFHPRLPADKKITRSVRDRLFGSWNTKPTGEIGLSVGIDKSTPLSEGRKIIEKYGATYEGRSRILNVIFVSVPEKNLENFEQTSREEKVRWVDVWPQPLSQINDQLRQVSGVDRMRMIYPEYTGWGVVAGIFDVFPVCQHFDFGDRLTIGVGEDREYCGGHGTHCAGIVGASGLMSEDWGNRVGVDIAPFQFQGIAPEVQIISYALGECGGWPGCLYNDAADIEQDFENFIVTYDVDSTSMSLGTNITRNFEPCEWLGDTSLVSILMDTITGGWAFGRELVHNQSAGNERSPNYGHFCGDSYGTAGTPAAGMKNSIPVGAVDKRGVPTDFTSWGPRDDGGLFPFGCIDGQDIWSTVYEDSYDEGSGTSMSAPAMQGVEDLIIQAFYKKLGKRPALDLIKAALANSFEETPTTPLGPDFQCGLGYMSEFSMLEAIETIHQERFIEDTINHGEEITYLMTVPEDTPEIRVTIVWRDEPGSIERQELGLPQLVNDIDISMENPFGGINYPLVPDPEYPDNDAAEKEDHLNNVEQIIIGRSHAGCYFLKVKGYNIPAGPQKFAIVYSGLAPWPPALAIDFSFTDFDKFQIPANKARLPTEDDGGS